MTPTFNFTMSVSYIYICGHCCGTLNVKTPKKQNSKGKVFAMLHHYFVVIPKATNCLVMLFVFVHFRKGCYHSACLYVDGLF